MPLAILPNAAPWLLLGLLFYIPGVYLEWPSDPWEHLRRINEWHAHNVVIEHSSWKKFSYFLPYSLTGQTTGPSQISWLNIYYTGISLLLCWQYYKLAQAAGLGHRASMIFTLMQALLMGNSIFSFYRYYGLSTSIFAQLGAIALTRITLEALRSLGEGKTPRFKGQATHLQPPARPATRYSILRSAGSGLALLPLITLNHLQGLGVGGLGVIAVIVWRLIEWKRTMFAWLVFGAVVLSIAAVFSFPRHAALDEVYRPQGWLNPWYGFNLLSLSSPALDRAVQILGAFGIINLTVGLWLIFRKNHIAGWLTCMPALILVLPCFTLPFAYLMVTGDSADDLITFHRMLLAVPVGLALTTQAAEMRHRDWRYLPAMGLGLLMASSAILVMASPRHPWYNRFFHVIAPTPSDLMLRHVTGSSQVHALVEERPAASLVPDPGPILQRHGAVIATPGLVFAVDAIGATLLPHTQRTLNWPFCAPPSRTTAILLENLQYVDTSAARPLNFPSVPLLFSPISTTGFLSKHWQPQEVALVHGTQLELSKYHLGPPLYDKRPPQIWLEWTLSEDLSSRPQGDPGPLLVGDSIHDRGRLTLPRTIYAGDRLSLRALMRTADGDGWRLSLSVHGPQEQAAWNFSGRPNPLGGVHYVSGDLPVKFALAGEYTIDLIGTLLWPKRYYTVRYHVVVLPSEN